jgi:hypothetical protein
VGGRENEVKGLEESLRLGHEESWFLAMKSLSHCYCWLASFLFVGRVCAADAPAAPPLFPDPKLEAVVRKYVFDKRDTDKPLVEADVINISTIEGKGLGVTNLTGLEKCVNLASLDLAKNRVRDLGALAGMTSCSTWTWPTTGWMISRR